MAARIDRFQRQHARIRDIVETLCSRLLLDPLAKDSTSCRRLLTELTGLVRRHAAMTGNILYARLIEHDDPEAKATASCLLDEICPLDAAFDRYAARWLRPGAIQRDPSGFMRHTRRIASSLLWRVQREEHDLYPLVVGARH